MMIAPQSNDGPIGYAEGGTPEVPAKSALDLRVYAILDPTRTKGRDPAELAAAAARGGATLIQLRDKTTTTRPLVDRARQVQRALAPFHVPLLINDRVDVAVAVGADGVHLGRDDMAPADARRLLGPEAIIGVTVHHDEEALAVRAREADYAGVGPVFQTRSKAQRDPPIGAAGLSRLIARIRESLHDFPCCGIAGISEENAPEVLRAGADGIALISGIFMEKDVEAAARRLRGIVDRTLDEVHP